MLGWAHGFLEGNYTPPSSFFMPLLCIASNRFVLIIMNFHFLMPLFCRSTIVQIYSFGRGNSNDRKADFADNADDFTINTTYISVTVN